MILIERVDELRAACKRTRAAGGSVGLVPTMGFFHEGHRSLMRAARRRDDLVVVTLFVNPLQFGAGEDLGTYPRDLDGDATAAALEGVDILFAPSVEEMYRSGARTTVRVDGLTEGMCGSSRPTHFDGVTTVVAKLFAIVGPCRAYFGRKDAQQLAVVRRMAADLDLPVEVVGCPLVREADGLAMSSRNAYLSPADRRATTVLHRALVDAAALVEAGERDAERVRVAIVDTVASDERVELEYVEVRTAGELERVAVIEGEVLVALAARVGTTRLIDNMTVSVVSSGAEHASAPVGIDLGVTVERQS